MRGGGGTKDIGCGAGVGLVMGHSHWCGFAGCSGPLGFGRAAGVVAEGGEGGDREPDAGGTRWSSGLGRCSAGRRLARALGSADKAVSPRRWWKRFAIAEEDGPAGQGTGAVGGAYEIELDRQLRMLVALAEPLLLFVMAGLIGTVVIACCCR